MMKLRISGYRLKNENVVLTIRSFTGVAHASIDAPPPMKMSDPLLIPGALCILGALVVSF